jgi:GT2 family glycosyltransferase
VTVVMPFAGDRAAALDALDALRSLRTGPGDELILADNSSSATGTDGVTVIDATGERSPARARNAGAEHAANDWILFLDADCVPPIGLLDTFFEAPIDPDVGALAGALAAARTADTLAARYGAARNFLDQQAHYAHSYRPRAVAANLLVRRAAFEQLGGFYEGVRAAEDTDFSWRLQEAGWRLELRPSARVEHRYRATVRELRRQWRGYAAGRAWLGRRYIGFAPEPAIARAKARAWESARPRSGRASHGAPRRPAAPQVGRLERSRYLALDAMLAGEELAGLVLSNRPVADGRVARSDASGMAPQRAHVVLVADRFPGRDDPLAEYARTVQRARVEAVARPDAVDVELGRALQISYREDDGSAARAVALLWLLLRHPLRSVRDRARRSPGEPPLRALAPAALRLARDRGARVQVLGGADAQASARRLAALASRPLDRRA